MSDTERLCQLVVNCTQSALDWASQYVDLDYILFIKWLLSPVILTFVILPAVILVLIYVSSLVLYIYQVHSSGTRDNRQDPNLCRRIGRGWCGVWRRRWSRGTCGPAAGRSWPRSGMPTPGSGMVISLTLNRYANLTQP